MRKGVQLYAIRALAKEDYEKAIRTISEIGYEGVELAGSYEGITAELIDSYLKKYKVEPIGAHIAPELIFDSPEETIKFHKTIGNHRIICPWYDLKTKEDVMELCEKIKRVAPLYHENGMELYYHNHAHEFQKDGGEYLIDILARETEGFLKLEFDVYWVYRGGEDPLAYLKKYALREDIFHAKDGRDEKGTTLGEGAVDIPAVFAFAKRNNMAWAVVESEACEDADDQVEAIRRDYQALVGLV